MTVRRGDSGDWVAGVVNAPLLTGDQIATASNSRAEVQFDAANALRMGGDASVSIAQLEYDHYQFQIARGTVTYRVLRPTDINIEVDTQNIAVRPSKQGVYRIRVDDAGESEITVRMGSVEVSTTAGSQWVNAGQTLLARGPAADPEFKITAAIPVDDWDRWNESRDTVEMNSAQRPICPARRLSGPRTWIAMEPGRASRTMAMFGSRTSPPVGLPTASASGLGSIGMDGLGSVTIPGAGLPTTTAGGSTAGNSAGLGIPAHVSRGITGRLGWWPSLAGAGQASDWAMSVGCPWRLTKRCAHGGDAPTMAGLGT